MNRFEADEALEKVNELTPFTFGEKADAMLDEVKNKIEAFGYDEAISTLNMLINNEIAY